MAECKESLYGDGKEENIDVDPTEEAGSTAEAGWQDALRRGANGTREKASGCGRQACP